MTYLNGSDQQVRLARIPRRCTRHNRVAGQHFLRRIERTAAGEEENLLQHGLLGTRYSQQHEHRRRGEPFLTCDDAGSEERLGRLPDGRGLLGELPFGPRPPPLLPRRESNGSSLRARIDLDSKQRLLGQRREVARSVAEFPPCGHHR